MKKFLAITLLLFVGLQLFSQHKRHEFIKWLHIAPKAGYGTSMLLTMNSFTDKSAEQKLLNPGYNLGGSLGVSIGDYLGFYAEAGTQSFGQRYNMQIQEGTSVDNSTTYSYLKSFDAKAFQITVMMRYISDLGGYFEIGPTFKKIKSVVVSNSEEYGQVDATQDDFITQYPGLAVGVGQAVFRSERLNLLVGARLTFSPQDFVLNQKFILDDHVYNSQNLLYDPLQYDEYNKTMPITGYLFFEVDYIFGFWGNASCGRGRLMLFQ